MHQIILIIRAYSEDIDEIIDDHFFTEWKCLKPTDARHGWCLPPGQFIKGLFSLQQVFNIVIILITIKGILK